MVATIKKLSKEIAKGASSVLDISGSQLAPPVASGPERDAEAIRNDFRRVGMDIQSAVTKFGDTHHVGQTH